MISKDSIHGKSKYYIKTSLLLRNTEIPWYNDYEARDSNPPRDYYYSYQPFDIRDDIFAPLAYDWS